MFHCWLVMLPELRDYTRKHMDPISKAHLAMTCSAEDTHRWQYYLTRFSGPRVRRHYARALMVYGSDAMVRDYAARHGSYRLVEFLPLLRNGREELFFSCVAAETASLLSFYDFDTRAAALRWRELCSPFSAREDVTEFWDVIENVPGARLANRHLIVHWAMQRRDLSLLSRLGSPQDGRIQVFGSDLAIPWLDTLVQHGLKLRVLVDVDTPFAILQRAKQHGLATHWTHLVYSDLDVMAVHLERSEGQPIKDNSWFRSAMHMVEKPGYWPRFFARFNVAWPLDSLVYAIFAHDYALITWLLAHPPWMERPRDKAVSLGEGRLRQQLIADGWFVDGKFVNKNTGETLSIVVVQ